MDRGLCLIIHTCLSTGERWEISPGTGQCVEENRMTRNVMWKVALGVAAALTFGMCQARADTITATNATLPSGDVVSASATLSIQNGNLVIVLTNTSTTTKTNSAVLTDFDFNASGVVFDNTKGSTTNANSSVTIPSGSSIFSQGSAVSGTDVSKFWGLATGTTFGTIVKNSSGGTSSNPFGYSVTAFGQGNNTVPFQSGSQSNMDGDDYGLVAKGSDTLNSGLDVLHKNYIANSVTITLAPSSGSLTSLSQLSNFAFSFSTNNWAVTPDQGPNPFSPVPEPTSIVLMSALFGGLAVFGYRRKRASAAA